MNWRSKPRRNFALFWKIFSLIFAYLVMQIFNHVFPQLAEGAFWASPLGHAFFWLIALFILYVTALMWIIRTR